MHHFSSQHTNYCEKSDLEHCPSSAKRSKLNEDTPRNDKEIRNVKIAAKKVRQRLNQTKRKELKIIYKKMINNLKEGGYFEEGNMKTKKQLPENPSYSMIYSFSGGLNIVMYNTTYALKNIKDIIHDDCGVRLTLGDNMVVIWHEGTLHNGGHSRKNEDGTIYSDLRLFSYIWRGSLGRSVRTEDGQNVYRNTKCVCRGIAGKRKKGFHCVKCEVGFTELDLTSIKSTSYDPGSKIIGDLETLGWVVVRGVSKITQHSDNNIEAIAEIAEIAKTAKHWNEVDGMSGRKM